MEPQTILINAAITMLSAGLLIISLISYKKNKNQNLFLLTTAFIFFFIKGAFLSLGLFYPSINSIVEGSYFGIFDVIVLSLLFISTLKRQRYA
jgi:hypothetical protein